MPRVDVFMPLINGYAKKKKKQHFTSSRLNVGWALRSPEETWTYKQKVFSEAGRWEALLLGEGLHVADPGSAALDASSDLISTSSLWLRHKDQDQSSCGDP